MPNRVNRAIELLEQDQPIYYTGGHTGANLSYEGGKEMASTWADYINVGMEHGSFDMPGLDQFMARTRGWRPDEQWPPHACRRGRGARGRVERGHRPGERVAVQADTRSRRSWHLDVPRRDPWRGEGVRRVLPLSVPDHWSRHRTRHRTTRFRWTGIGGPDLGGVCGRVSGQGPTPGR